jgi:hypothetical protein
MSDIEDDSGPDYSGSGPVEYQPAEAAPRGAIEQVLASEQARLMGVPGVVSVGIGYGPAGGEALTVGVVDAGVAARLPGEIKGVPLIITVTGPVDALRHR